MSVAKHAETATKKTVNEVARGKVKGEESAHQIKPELNPLWHAMATFPSQHHGAAGADGTGPVQPKLKVGAQDDKYEKEADAVAGQVMRMPVGSAGLEEPLKEIPSLQTRSLRSPFIQRVCADCEEAPGGAGAPSIQTRSNVAVSQPSVPNSVANTISSPVSGSPLNESVRSRVEPVLGSDLSSVRVHNDAPAQAASQGLNAKAFTHKNNIFLGQGQSDADVQLMAHESTHVVQQTGGRDSSLVQREGDEHANETYDEFVARVRSLAIARLASNIGVLTEWKGYIRSMEGFQLQAQLLTSLAMDYASNAAASPSPLGPQRFETWAGTDSAAQRRFEGTRLATDASYRERVGGFMGFLEAQTQGYMTSPSVAQRMQVMTGELSQADLPLPVYVPPDPRYEAYRGPIERWQSGESGGCQTCHDINRAWTTTANMWGDPLPSGDLFSGFHDFGPMLEPVSPSSTGLDDQEVAAIRDWIIATESGGPPPPVSSPVPTAGTSAVTSSPEPATTSVNPYLPDVELPEALELPPPRSNLCGPLPTADDLDSSRNFNPSLWGPNSHIVYQTIQRVGAVLTPLGPKGYRVIERRNFDALWAAGPGQLEGVRDDIISQISQRQADYGSLQERIRYGITPYYDLCPIVDELLPSTNMFVRMQVRQEIFEQKAIEFLVQALDWVLLALAIIYPPSIVATMPLRAALAVTRFAIGAEQYRRGGDYSLGTGSGVFSGHQEAEAESLQTTGQLNMFASVLDIGMLGYGRWAARQPSGMFEDELLTRGWRQAHTPAGTMWHMPGDGRSIWQTGSTFEFVDVGNRTVGYLDDVGGRLLLRGPGSGSAPVSAMTPATAGTGGGSTLAPFGQGSMAPYLSYSPTRMLGPVAGPAVVMPVVPQGGVLLGGGQGVWMRGSIVTPPPQQPFGYLPASGSSGMPEGEWVIANFSPGGSLADVPATSLPYAGNRAWGRSGGNWWLYRPAQSAPAPAVMHQYLGPGGDRALVLDITGQTRSLYTEPLTVGSSQGRGYPMTTSAMTDPATKTRLARSHLVPHARSLPMVLPEGPGMSSTRDSLNYVGHDRRYNEWVRRTLEGRLSGSRWEAMQFWQNPRGTTGGYPIVTEEVIVEIGSNGQAVRAWRFPTTEGYWDAFSDINVILGPRYEGGFQIPVDEIPQTLVGVF